MKSFVLAGLIMFLFGHTIQAQTVSAKGVTYLITPQKGLNLFPDSIRMEFPDHRSLFIIEMSDVSKDLNKILQFPDSLKGWLEVIRKSTSSQKVPSRVDMRVRENGEKRMVISFPEKTETNIAIDHQAITELLPPGWRIYISGPGYKAQVYAQDFEGLTGIANSSFELPVMELKKSIDLNPLGRRSLKCRFIMKDAKVQYSDLKRSIAADFIMGRASAGFGYLSDRFYPELNVDLSIRLGGRYNRYNQSINFSYNNLFFTERNVDGSYTTSVNSFINVSWNKNLNYKRDHPQWIGLGAGYLIQNRGSYFTGNTMKLFISKDIGNFDVTPELYLTNDFKSSLLGIKVNYTF